MKYKEHIQATQPRLGGERPLEVGEIRLNFGLGRERSWKLHALSINIVCDDALVESAVTTVSK